MSAETGSKPVRLRRDTRLRLEELQMELQMKVDNLVPGVPPAAIRLRAGRVTLEETLRLSIEALSSSLALDDEEYLGPRLMVGGMICNPLHFTETIGDIRAMLHSMEFVYGAALRGEMLPPPDDEKPPPPDDENK